MIPSPPLNHLSLGPLTLHFYGLIIAIAIITCYSVALKIAKQRNFNEKDIEKYFLLVLPIAFITARTYHIATNWSYYSHNIYLIPQIWNGGLGILGGILGGIVVIYFLSRQQKRRLLDITDLLAVVIPLGHAIGRWGNYFNQELFGKPTKLPWGLQISAENRPSEYKNSTTFHPTFLYESILNLINFSLLYYLYTKKTFRPGFITGIYFINYGLIRLLIESIKIDPDVSAQIGPLRVPQYFSLLLLTAGIILIGCALKKSQTTE